MLLTLSEKCDGDAFGFPSFLVIQIKVTGQPGTASHARRQGGGGGKGLLKSSAGLPGENPIYLLERHEVIRSFV